MSFEYVDLPPPAEQRIDSLHCWIATYADDSEGIISADMPLDFGSRHTPLLSSKRDVAEKMEAIVQRARRETMHLASKKVVSVRLVTFVRS